MYWLRLRCTKSDEEPKHPVDWIEYDHFLVAGDLACGIASLTPARVSSERDKSIACRAGLAGKASSLPRFRSTPDSKSQWIFVIPSRFLPLAPLRGLLI